MDFIDFHIYPFDSLTKDYLQTTLTWADDVRSLAPGKLLTIGEAWTYKTTAAEVSAGIDYTTVYGRDMYSFWEPIDRQFLDVLFKMMHYKRFTAIMPFWSQYYFAYLTYGDASLNGLTPIQLIALAGQDATQNIPSVTHTGTGQRFKELLATPPDADGDGVPDAVDSSDTDGDGLPDSADACPLYHTSWAVPAGDTDCDGFPDTAAASGHASESFLGTRSLAACAETAAANDEPMADAWPMDFNDDQKANLSDVLRYSPVFNTTGPGPPYSVRFDLNGDNHINLSDVLQFSPFFNQSCAP